ncbi:Cof-type HAD-IIB family hydrolase [Agromyces protaetiae]|uniref:Cof-type HAD-IIB family hydrolase n=1 Tax=Agromyces protaetiae TaxID=2509455 RepID=A0A4P6FAI4_9MICO|nr:Cof-type HAD-IIB family hydrolase [Agromyces protaetiae]QAY71963.1 Cof-type HAD-IIB family hydrolase [Agromyces protaetiae]
MTRPRIAFLDVDGTILEHGDVVAPSTVAAVRAARSNGHLVWLCTGRSAGDLHPAVVEIGFDGAITNGGAFATVGIGKGAERVVSHRMSRADVDRLLAYFGEHGIHFFLQSDAAVFASPGVAALTDEYFRRMREAHAADLEALGISAAESGSRPAREPMLRHRPLAEADLDDIAKAVFISPADEGLARAQADLGDRFHVIPGSIPMPGGSNGEIGLNGVDKGTAIVEVLVSLGLDAADAIGIGDSWNDVGMFAVVGTPIAMGNADLELQTIAGEVTTSVLDDGIWNAFVRHGLIRADERES